MLIGPRNIAAESARCEMARTIWDALRVPLPDPPDPPEPLQCPDVHEVAAGKTCRERIEPDEPPFILGGKDSQREKDLAHMAERLRDLAAMAQDGNEPDLELDVFRLQLQLHGK